MIQPIDIRNQPDWIVYQSSFIFCKLFPDHIIRSDNHVGHMVIRSIGI